MFIVHLRAKNERDIFGFDKISFGLETPYREANVILNTCKILIALIFFTGFITKLNYFQDVKTPIFCFRRRPAISISK